MMFPTLTDTVSTDFDRGVTTVDVSVCIVNWNCRELLRKCLISMFEQEQGATFEVIVVDNGSVDGAPEMVEAEFPRVRLIRNPDNRGFSKANNQAAQLAGGRYYFFLNNDTELSPHTLIDLVEYAEQHPHVGMIGPRLLGADGQVQISYRNVPTISAVLHRISLLRWTCLFRDAYLHYRRSSFEAVGTRPVESLMGAAVFLRRDIFLLLDGWDEAYFFGVEDIDLTVRARELAEVVYHGDVEVLHHGRVSSRENVGYARVLSGYVHFFRKTGTSEWALRVYKLAVTLDVPLQLSGKVFQTMVRALCGKFEKARKSWHSARELGHFLCCVLPHFWRA